MDLTSADTRYWLQAAIFGLLALSAWRWGRGPERLLAGVLVWFSAGDAINHALFEVDDRYMTVDTGHLVIDLVALAVSLAVALRANRIYPLWFASFQLLAVMAHLARDVAQEAAPLAYLVMYIGPSYCQIIVLAVGIWCHRRRELRYGPYRSWRTSSPRSRATAPPNWPTG
ncbi:hypothetical protein A6F68_01222 [Tsuneonella dongtanensis]|uniref:Uncharacterized protein n=1 Tax=Tsuneonella dongtanensis TaxID=692370 RepID=A0A1B2AC50_9SPHN|nr:hypothetical protein [Tsuneonella dongtanensis]ANY19739.1 hypothetical protein A6F68_01222 [Tsuneonella dongtanensis]